MAWLELRQRFKTMLPHNHKSKEQYDSRIKCCNPLSSSFECALESPPLDVTEQKLDISEQSPQKKHDLVLRTLDTHFTLTERLLDKSAIRHSSTAAVAIEQLVFMTHSTWSHQLSVHASKFTQPASRSHDLDTHCCPLLVRIRPSLSHR